MRRSLLLSGLTGMLLAANLYLAAQDMDSLVTSASRSSATIADGIKDPAERSAFVTITRTKEPQKLLALTRSFLKAYPRSAFLAEVAEGAARASFDLGDLQSGLDYARFSLSLTPENPLLLVAVADVRFSTRMKQPLPVLAMRSITSTASIAPSPSLREIGQMQRKSSSQLRGS
jgi:hypothetical protein